MRFLLRHVDSYLSLASAVVLFFLMAVTVVDVLGRYVFNRPLPGSAEISATLLAILVYLCLAQINYRMQNIKIDLLNFSATSTLGRVSTALTRLSTAFCSAWLAFELTFLAGDFARRHDMSSYLNIPWAPLAYFMALMALLAALYSFITPRSIE